MEPVVTRTELPGDPRDAQSRYIEAAVNGILIGCLYAPNGNPQPGPKFDYKLAWLERLIAHAAELSQADVPAVLIGDLQRRADRARHLSDQVLRQGCAAAAGKPRGVRAADQAGLDRRDPHAASRRRDLYVLGLHAKPLAARRGLRLDHILLSPELAERLKAAGVDRAVRGKPNASDHAPVWVELGAVKRGRVAATVKAPRFRSAAAKQVPARTPQRRRHAEPRRCW